MSYDNTIHYGHYQTSVSILYIYSRISKRDTESLAESNSQFFIDGLKYNSFSLEDELTQIHWKSFIKDNQTLGLAHNNR